jgi:TolA-binding protein
MAFLRQSLLILLALVLSGEIAFAAGNAKEQRDFAAAAGAFNDGMYPRAAAELDQFKQNYPNSTNAPMAVLLAAQAEFKQGEFTNAIARLKDASNLAKAGILADQYAYWTGEAQFASSNFLAAAEIFTSLPQKFPESPLRLQAVVEAAAAYVQSSELQKTVKLLEETNGVFQRAAQLDPGNELVSRGRLLLAQAKFAQKDFDGAAAVLELVNSQMLPLELAGQRAYLLYQIKLASGDLDAALAATTNLLQIAQLEKSGDLTAESVAAHAEVLERMGRVTEAMAAYQENLKTNVPVQMQREAALKVAELAMAQNQFTNAEPLLEKFPSQKFLSQFADIALLTAGELHLKSYVAQPAVATNDLQEAQSQFNQFIGEFTNSPLLGNAYLDRGWCDWLAWKFSGDISEISNSLSDFKAAAEKLPPSEDLAVAKFKMGDAMFALTNYAGALENYRAVLDNFTNFPVVGQTLGGPALFQRLRADLDLTNMEDASDALEQMLKFHPDNELADDSLLLLGEKLTDLRQPATARSILEKFREMNLTSPLRPQVDLAIARTYEQQQNWPAAIGQYEIWLNDFPANELLPQVEYERAWANFQAGNEANAFGQFTNFVAEFPTNEFAPQAQWWIADHFFRLGGTNYLAAEKNYAAVFQNTNWQDSPLVYPAQMMAGRAAMAWGGYSDAIHYFTGLTGDTNCPPDLNAQALFAYGSVLMLTPSDETNNPLANFKLAASVFGQISPTNELSALAEIKIGDCDLQLTNYDDATNAYAAVFNSTNADVSARSEAQIGFGIALEKMAALMTGADQNALLKMAQDNYYSVFQENEYNSRHELPADPFWQKKAALETERLDESLQEWTQAVKIYRDMTNNWSSLQPALQNNIEKLIKEHPEAAPH